MLIATEGNRRPGNGRRRSGRRRVCMVCGLRWAGGNASKPRTRGKRRLRMPSLASATSTWRHHLPCTQRFAFATASQQPQPWRPDMPPACLSHSRRHCLQRGRMDMVHGLWQCACSATHPRTEPSVATASLAPLQSSYSSDTTISTGARLYSVDRYRMGWHGANFCCASLKASRT